MLRQFLADYLNFTRKERIGIITTLILLIFFLLLPFFFHYFKDEPVYDHSRFQKEIESLNIKQQDSSANYTNRNFDENNYQPSGKSYAKQTPGELFYFDPNTLSVEGWKKLGVREKTASTIQHYTAKGGRFNKPGDIAKIWGLHEDEIKRLLPYVRIEASATKDFSSSKNPESYTAYEREKKVIASVDINEADTSAFIALPGIGSKLANRIINFREKLGGFYKMEQVAETYALPDSTFQKIKEKLVIRNSNVKKININNATLDELKIHPYIRYNIANAILQYRTLHGNFLAVGDLKKIMIITDDIYNKVAPYLTVK